MSFVSNKMFYSSGQIEDSPELKKETNVNPKNKPTKKKPSAASKNISKDSKVVSFVNIKTQNVGSNQSAKIAVKRKTSLSTDVLLVKQKKNIQHIVNQSITSEKSKKSKKVVTVKKNAKTIVNRGQSSTKLSDHKKCKLRLSKYDKAKHISNREDGRVFTWNLIFRVCECSESDVVL